MRKFAVIFILIMLVAVSVACASEVEIHIITLKCTVSEVKPVFEFEFTSGMLEGQEPVTVGFSDYDETGDTSRRTVIYVPSLREDDLNLVFTAKLANDARCYGSYTVSLVPGDFFVNKEDGMEILSPSSVVVEKAENIASQRGLEAQYLSDDSGIKVTFNGARCTVGNLATFNVTYPSDPDIKPDIYYADISLEISSDF